MPQSSSTYHNVLVYIDTMPDESVTFHLNTSQNGTKTITYYVEALQGQTPAITYNGKGFVVYKTLDAKYGWFTEDEDYIDIAGFSKGGTAYPPRAYNSNGTQLNSVWDNDNARNVQCFYTRNTYSINFMDGKYVNGDNNPIEEAGMGQIGTEDGISYGADVSSHNTYKPDAEHTPSGYVFEGWYIDSACTHPYEFNKMPEGGITVYAKWRQKQYRVFLHVNYPEGATGNINWGTPNQEMNFRVSEGGHVSEPTGRDLAGFDFVGWYLDEDCTQVFNGEAYTINESSVTDDYDKTVDMTDTYDNNGFLIDPKYNSDATGYNGGDRFWITKKLDIYAKWRSTLDGASGIVVEYDANGGTGAPTDTNTYVDGAKAPAGPASKPRETGKVFSHWVVQKWNGTKWEDTDDIVLPGDTFTVRARNAKVEDIVNPPQGGDTKKYTVRLKAEYAKSQAPTPTHIYWYMNDGSDAYIKNDNAVINVGVDVPKAPRRDGYTFLGWARVDIGNTREAAATWEATESNWEQNLTASNLYLHYADDGTYHLNSTSGKIITQVAPDENKPYHAMFAVWKKQVKITVKDAEKEYNGSQQYGNDITTVTGTSDDVVETEEYKVEGLAEGDVLTVSRYTLANGTDVGTYENGTFSGATITITNSRDEDVTDSYDIETIAGKLTITQKTLTLNIKGKTDTKTYNGEEQTVSGWELDESTPIPADADFTVDDIALAAGKTAEAKRTNEGKTDMGLTAEDFSVESDNYIVTFEVTDGWIKINKKDITITAGSNEKVYDGSPLTDNTYEVTSGSVATGDAIESVTVTGSQTEVGESDNVPSAAVIKHGNTDVTSNYNITYANGKLEVTKRAITITAISSI